MRIDARHLPIQVTKLRRQPWIEFQHRQPVTGGVEKKLHVKQAACKTHCVQEAARNIQCLLLYERAQRTGIVPALKGLGARIGMRIDDAQQVYAALIDPAIEIVLSALQRFLNQEAAGVVRGRQPSGDDTLKGCKQVVHRPTLECAKACQPQVVVRLIEPAREDGKRAAHWFDMYGELQIVRHAIG